MLKYRIGTALILIPVLLAAIWWLPMPWFAILMAGVMLWAAWEWSRLCSIRSLVWRLSYLGVLIACLVGVYFIPIAWVLTVALLIWLWALVAVICYQFNVKPAGFQHRVISAAMGIFALAPAWMAISVLREDLGGPGWLLFGFVVVWTMDTGAYAAGNLWGKHRLISRVSPNKTWEGLGGGFASVLILSLVICLAFRVSFDRLLIICSIALITAFFAVVGDLLESQLKRQAGVKDSGSVLPGHGGVLDRIDSLLAALPIFALGSLWWSHYL